MKIVWSEEGFIRLDADKAWNKLTDAQRKAWTSALVAHVGVEHEYAWLGTFTASSSKSDAAMGKAGKPLIKAFVSAFGVRDPHAEAVLDGDGNFIADDELTDFENIPLGTKADEYMAAEVLPHARDAYIDESYRDEQDGGVGVVGYEINFNRYFYEYQPPRDLHLIDADLKVVESEISQLLAEVTS